MIALVFLVQSRFNKTYPDALNCGIGEVKGAIYMLHGISY